MALRAWKHNAAAAAAIVVSLAMGLAAAGSAFAVVSSTFLRPLPVRDEGGLFVVQLRDAASGGPGLLASQAVYRAWRRDSAMAQGLAGRLPVLLEVGWQGSAERLPGALVSENYFELLGVSPILGRVSANAWADDPEQCALSFQAWLTGFGGAPDVVGRSVTIGGRSLRIAAILPEEFSEWSRPDAFWLPITSAPSFLPRPTLEETGYRTTQVIGRLRNRVPLVAVETELDGVLRATDPEAASAGVAAEVLSLRASRANPALGRTALLLQAAGLLVLVLGFANAASGMISRSLARAGERALRVALGARPGHLLREQASETALLLLPALGLGLALTSVALGPLRGFLGGGVLPLDWRVLLMSVALALGMVLALVGTSAAIARRTDLSLLLQGHPGAVQARLHLGARRAFLVLQVSLATGILVLAAALTLSVWRIEGRDLGFRTADTFALRVRLPAGRFDATALLMAAERLEARLRSLPGIEAAGVGSTMPFLSEVRTSFSIQGGARILNSRADAPRLHRVSPGYLEALAIRPILGRGFEASDGRVAVISETMARLFWPGAPAVGQRLKLERSDLDWIEIVGVVPDLRFGGAREQRRADLFLPLRVAGATSALTLVFRPRPGADVAGVPAALLSEELTGTVHSLVRLADLAQLKERTTREVRQAMLLLGLAALLLVVSGAYAVSSLVVQLRLREIAVRTALGASPRSVALEILGSTARPTLAGMILGCALGAAGTRAAGFLLYEVTATDALPGLAGSTLVFVGALGASLPTLRRALRLDPLALLRSP